MYHTKICKFDEYGFPVHLCDLNGLLPNVYVGMEIRFKKKMYKVKNVISVVDINFCRQIIQVVDL